MNFLVVISEQNILELLGRFATYVFLLNLPRWTEYFYQCKNISSRALRRTGGLSECI